MALVACACNKRMKINILGVVDCTQFSNQFVHAMLRKEKKSAYIFSCYYQTVDSTQQWKKKLYSEK